LTTRFGVVHTDFETFERTPKESARFVCDVSWYEYLLKGEPDCCSGSSDTFIAPEDRLGPAIMASRTYIFLSDLPWTNAFANKIAQSKHWR